MADETTAAPAPPPATDEGGHGTPSGYGGFGSDEAKPESKPSDAPTQDGGQGKQTEQGQPSGDKSQEVTPARYKELQGAFTRTSQENAELKRRMQLLLKEVGKLPGSDTGGQKTSGIKLPDNLKDVLGESAANEFQELLGSLTEQVRGESESTKKVLQRQQFFGQFPEMRQYESEMDGLKQLADDPNSVMTQDHLLALAVRGAHIQEIVDKAVQADREKRQTQNKTKGVVGAGGGTPPTPTEGMSNEEMKSLERKAIWGLE